MVSIFCGVMLALMLRFPAVVLESAHAGLSTFARSVLPTLYPYMVFCQLTSDRIARAAQRPVLPCALLGLLGGSPNGARTAAMLFAQGRISAKTLRVLCALCGTVSPIFLIGTISAWTGSDAFGLRVLITHVLGAAGSAAIVALIPQRRAAIQPPSADPHTSTAPLSFPEAAAQSAQAMLSIGGCIAIFSVLAGMPGVIFPSIPTALRAALHALLEMSGGSFALLRLGWPRRIACCAVSACVSFGGLSILMQNMTFLRTVGVRTGELIAMRLIHAAISAALCWIH